MYTLSIVIPMYNEEENISKCLESIIDSINYLNIVYDIKCDIIVVDDGSTDNSKQIVESYSLYNNYIDYITIIQGNHEGVATARHIGTIYSNSDIIISTDADIVVPENWLMKIYSHFYNDNKLIAVSGIYKEMYNRLFETLSTYNANFLFHGLGGNTAFKRNSYLSSNGYDTSVSYRGGTDIRLWNNLGNMGKVIHDNDIYVLHNTGYRWRSATVYSLSAISILLGSVLSIPLLKMSGASLAGYELINKNKYIA